MLLSDLLKYIDYIECDKLNNPIISSINYDSRLVEKGSIFVAIEGYSHNGNNFINDALDRGAAVIVSEKKINIGKSTPFIRVTSSRKTLAEISKIFYNSSCDRMRMVGITGTNGKTTTCFMIKSIMNYKFGNTGMISTIHSEYRNRILPSERTTPESSDLHSIIFEMYKSKCNSVVLEVSSHALSLKRVHGIKFDIVVFTNLTHDHLDFYNSMEDYFDAKKNIFYHLRNLNSLAIINIDDYWGKKIADGFSGNLLTIGSNKKANISYENVRLDNFSTCFTVNSPWGCFDIKLPLVGKFNIYNAMVAIAVGGSYGIKNSEIQNILKNINPIPGRLELISCLNRKNIFIDYAHSNEALKSTLHSLKEICEGNLIIVFGCGGNRDQYKRPQMGESASKLADQIIITSDNPRSEDPIEISNQIIKGCRSLKNVEIIIDRRKAIESAMRQMLPNDTLLIAGKGHETYQEIKGVRFPFNDRTVVMEYLKE